MCEACILAGGLSSRMGQDKAGLRLGGRSLLSHVRKAARQAGLRVRVIRRDLVPDCGPLGGIYTALRTTSAEAVLFLSCDMPFVNAALLEELCSRLTRQLEAVFVVSQRRLGFPCLIRRRALGKVEQLLARRVFALQTLAHQLKAARLRLPPDQATAVFNINTPEDYAAARSLWNSLNPGNA
jgi:molybdenum cofactor guanylyltransferase